MPAGDFAPDNPALVDSAGVYLIKGSTLAKLLQRIEFMPADFDVRETPAKREVSLKGADSSSASASEGVTVDFALLDCTVNAIDFETDPATWPVQIIMRIVIENGRVVSFNDSYTARPAAAGFTYHFIQSCCWVDDPPEDDWRGG